MSKEALIKARVSAELKEEVARLAQDRGESEAVIIREAINAYIINDAAAASPSGQPIVHVTYRPRRKSSSKPKVVHEKT